MVTVNVIAPTAPILNLHKPTNGDNIEITTFVDDTSCNLTFNKYKDYQSQIDKTYDTLKDYMTANKLILNQDKTKLIIISQHPDTKKNLKINTGNEIIQPTAQFKYLGLQFNEKLDWKHYLIESKDSLKKQLIKRISALKTIRKYSTVKQMRTLANGLFKSKLLYGAELWGAAPKYLKKQLKTLQLDVARLVIGPSATRMPTQQLLDRMKWLTLDKQLILSSARLSHQIIHQKVPTKLHHKMTQHLTTQPRHTRISGDYRLGNRPRQIGRTRITRQQYPAQAYQNYQHIPEVITNITKKKLFIKWLKRYLHNTKDLPPTKDTPVTPDTTTPNSQTTTVT